MARHGQGRGYADLTNDVEDLVRRGGVARGGEMGDHPVHPAPYFLVHSSPPIPARVTVGYNPHRGNNVCGAVQVALGFSRVWEARGVPRKPGSLGRPADHFVGGRFPDGRLRASAPAGAAEMAHVARALRGRLEELDLPIAVLAQNCGVDRTTIHDLLAGRSFIDVVTLARIETAVGARLWPCDIER